MELPFLKNRKIPRMAKDKPDDKLVNASSQDHIDDYCTQELMDACASKDVKRFRSALEALILNLFQDETPAHD
jgi:hypothetical protein